MEFENGCKSISSSKSSDKLLPTFYTTLLNLVDDEKDLQWMLKKFDLYNASTGTFNISDNAIMKNNVNSVFFPKTENHASLVSGSLFQFKKRPSFQKWKSVEENVALFFESMVDVVKVTDVSKSNLGYDLEVQWKDEINYVEIKVYRIWGIFHHDK